MKFSPSTPIFRMFDESKAREFYLDYLGFEIVFEHRFSEDAPLYMGLKKGECLLHLSEHHGDSTPGSAIRIPCSDVYAYNAWLKEKKYKYLNPGVQDQSWGAREMTAQDPFGNRLIFFEEIDAL